MLPHYLLRTRNDPETQSPGTAGSDSTSEQHSIRKILRYPKCLKPLVSNLPFITKCMSLVLSVTPDLQEAAGRHPAPGRGPPAGGKSTCFGSTVPWIQILHPPLPPPLPLYVQCLGRFLNLSEVFSSCANWRPTSPYRSP